MSALVALFIECFRHVLRVVGVAFFVLSFVTFTTRSRADWFTVTIGAALGLFFGLVFVFGDQWADVEDRREV